MVPGMREEQLVNEKRCVVCGAKVTGPYPSKTCDRTCGRARRDKRTRQAQIAYEMELPADRFSAENEAQRCLDEFNEFYGIHDDNI